MRLAEAGLPAALASLATAVAVVLIAAAVPAAATAAPLSEDQAVSAASRLGPVQAELAGRAGVSATALRQDSRWIVTFLRGGEGRAQVELDARSGRPLHVYTGLQASFPLARGGESGVGRRKVNAWWAWVPLTAVFLLAFFDPRRPFRLLHVDLAVVAMIGISYAFFLSGDLDASVPLVYPPLAYLLGRGLWAGVRPRERAGRLTWMTAPGLAMLTLALIAARIALTLTDPFVMDVGYASTAGADRVMHGLELFTRGGAHFDTYGPIAYLAYIPFVLLWPFHESQTYPPAAQAAAVTFDLLTAAGLLVLGRRLRPGTLLGWALALAWVACPFTTLALTASSNDALVSALLVWAFVAIASPPARGALTGAAAAAKFAPALLAPLMARGRGRPTARGVVVFAAAFALVALVTLVPLLPAGGVREFYDATIGFQLHRFSPFSIWSQHPGLDWLQTALKAFGIGLAAAVALMPRGERSVMQVAGLATAVLVALQLPLQHWFYLYVPWFLPLFCLAVLGEHAAARASARTETP